MSMKKRATKSIAIALVGISIAIPTLNASYAMELNESKTLERVQNDNLIVKVIEDNSNRKAVEVIDGSKSYITVFDKVNNALTSEVKQDGIIIDSNFVDINDIEESNTQIETLATESLGCIYSKLRYNINMKSWTITNSKGSVKKKPETVSHKDNLYRFRDAVRSSRQSENAARAAMDLAKLSIIMGSITASTGIGAIVSAVTAMGGSIGAAYNIWDSVVYRKEADRYFAIL